MAFSVDKTLQKLATTLTTTYVIYQAEMQNPPWLLISLSYILTN